MIQYDIWQAGLFSIRHINNRGLSIVTTPIERQLLSHQMRHHIVTSLLELVVISKCHYNQPNPLLSVIVTAIQISRREDASFFQNAVVHRHHPRGGKNARMQPVYEKKSQPMQIITATPNSSSWDPYREQCTDRMYPEK